jgi:hypothetical protein
LKDESGETKRGRNFSFRCQSISLQLLATVGSC